MLSIKKQVDSRDYRSQPSRDAFGQTVSMQPDDALCVAVGGGPHHVHPKMVNLNIGLFPNVYVVGDAYTLPYADNSVDAIHCEAVLEHLEFPNRAVEEMYRVLRVGGQVFAATPFMQHFHAYPNHFQNFTTHVRIPILRQFLSAGVALFALLVRPLDTRFNRSPQAHLLASTTYAHLVKPHVDITQN